MGHNLMQKGAPALLRETKSTIGEPIVRTVECLKNTGVIEDVPVFIRVDQVEELAHGLADPSANLRLAFRQALNSVLSRRDLRVAYRLASRPYGWDAPGHLNVLGGGVLEEKRDFLAVDFDEAFRRKENVAGNFEHFAADAFERRIKYFLKEEIKPGSDLLQLVFSRSESKKNRVKPGFPAQVESTSSFARTLAIADTKEAGLWSEEWRRFLVKICEADPLDAVLAAAWGRQTGGGSRKTEHRQQPPPVKGPYPWRRKWWRKERLSLAALQLSARRGQRLLWCGKRDILDLSGGNILAFLGLCHGVWNEFQKIEQGKPQMRFALSCGVAGSGRIFDGVTRGGRAPGVALDPWLISCDLSGHSVGGLADIENSQTPYSIGVFAFSREIELSPRSRLMGGQFPVVKCPGAFKNPIFYGGCRGANRSKNELSFLMVQNSSFYTLFQFFSAESA
jgi:hypothetical protein